jgi:hypothetical protein
MSNPHPKTVAKAAGLPPPPKKTPPQYRAPYGRTVSAARCGDGWAPPKKGWTVVVDTPPEPPKSAAPVTKK